MRTKANNVILEDYEKLGEKRNILYSLKKETRKNILMFYHWEAMSPNMILKTAKFIEQNQL